ncbi:MAG: tRNA (guanosine(37)-N1)-methyltransferase TrmD [Deltaproteobacteria bacterium]|nr:tRNA (guanosine(37)-N1)-methyltransferase TrmD [Deltaproteobacteria bacterium]
MDFTVLTIFPDMFHEFWNYGIVGRAIAQKHISASTLNIRDCALDKHRVTDDRPYGGGCGMVMKPEPLARAIREAKQQAPSSATILLTPQGRPFNQETARSFAREDGFILVCGRYEGIDERIFYDLVDHEVSIGDYILTGGELAAMIVIEAVTRLIPGVLGGEDSAELDSFSGDLLEHAHFTRPPDFEGQQVPKVLLSGNHREIEKWRFETSVVRTFLKRPDLMENRALTRQEVELLKEWCSRIERIVQAQSACGTDSPSGRQQKRRDHCFGGDKPGSA